MRWFTSDTHFFHKNVLVYDERPFKDIEEMQETIITNWNNCVSKKDIVYHLGDFAFGNPKRWKAITDRLQGNINLIRGNHDIQNGATLRRLVVDGIPLFNDVGDYECISLGEYRVIVSHYPYSDIRMREYSPLDTGLWLLHGHCHKSSPKIGARMINVGCMLWEYRPVSECEILQIIRRADEMC